MNRIKKLAYLSVIVLVSVFAISTLVLAYMDTYNVSGGNVNVGGEQKPADAVVGAASELATYFMGELKTDDLYVTDDTEMTGDLSVGGDMNLTDVLQYGGVESDWIEGTCADATTTLFAVANPWSATAYVDKLMLFVTNGTSTVQITVGTSTATMLTSDPSDLLLDDVEVATSTIKNAMNSLAGGSRTETSGFVGGGTNSEDIILWRSGEYIAAYAAEQYGIANIANAANTFSCTYKIHSFK